MEDEDSIDHMLSGKLAKELAGPGTPGSDFLPIGSVEKILTEENVRRLFANRLWTDEDSYEVRESDVTKTLTTCRFILATLIMVRFSHYRKKFRQLFLQNDSLGDEYLPFAKEKLIDPSFLGEPDGSDFYRGQFRTISTILCSGDNNVFSNRPLPIVEAEQKIGEGSYGTVYKLRVKKGHWQNKNQDFEIARKVFPDCADYEQELDVLNKVKAALERARQEDIMIMLPLGTLQYGTEFSLLFPLADCNLHELFDINKHQGPEPLNSTQRFHLLGAMVGLANALAWLHENMISEKQTKILCLHLDLKPKNILVKGSGSFNFNTLKLIISDFGISRIKEDAVDTVNTVLLPTGTPTGLFKVTSKPKTRVKRNESTFLAPEVERIGSGYVGTPGDVWSLGCIYALCVTFMVGQSAYISQFEQRRIGTRRADLFYYRTADSIAIPSSDVSEWLDKLCEEEEHADSGIVCGICRIIEKRMLLVEEKCRRKASEVAKQLDSIRGKLEEQSRPQDITEQRLSRIQNPSPTNVQTLAAPSFTFIRRDNIHLERKCTRSILTSDGKYVAYLGEKGQHIYLARIESKAGKKSHIIDIELKGEGTNKNSREHKGWRHALSKGKSSKHDDDVKSVWSLMCLSESYLCSVAFGNQVYLSKLPDSDHSVLPCKIPSGDRHSLIDHIAISTNSKYLAIASEKKVWLYQGYPRNPGAPVFDANHLSTIEGEIRQIGFSGDGERLFISATKQGGKIATVYCWSTSSRVQTSFASFEQPDELYAPIITAMYPFSKGDDCLIVSEKLYVFMYHLTRDGTAELVQCYGHKGWEIRHIVIAKDCESVCLLRSDRRTTEFKYARLKASQVHSDSFVLDDEFTKKNTELPANVAVSISVRENLPGLLVSYVTGTQGILWAYGAPQETPIRVITDLSAYELRL